MYLNSLELKNFRKIKDSQKVEFAHDLLVDDNLEEINISTDTTLIVGKNNSGKTSIVKALLKLTNPKLFTPSDFNFRYLNSLLEKYVTGDYEELPEISFKIIIGSDKPETDRTSNFYQFMKLESDKYSDDKSNTEIDNDEEKERESKEESDDFHKHELYTIHGIYKSVNTQLLRSDLEKLGSQANLDDLLEVISNNNFDLFFYNSSQRLVKNFKLKNLIEVEFIEANQIKRDDVLSASFSRIFNHNLKHNLQEPEKEQIKNSLKSFNEEMESKANISIAKSTKESLQEMIHSSNMDMILTGNLQSKDIFNKVIKYNYLEDGIKIPETQFGLGYTNLMVIVTKILDYLEVYRDEAFNSQINILAIEEPETFMHPQMQELLIKNINNMINSLLQTRNKSVRAQIVITTHSSHILNSKIQSSKSFDKINYLTTIKGNIQNIPLKNTIIIPDNNKGDLQFLLKHITYYASELFFSDAVILVEGPTEETLIRYFIDNMEMYNDLRKFYITIFNIDGAHAKVYESLLRVLKIPTLVITDLDIKNSTRLVESDTIEESGTKYNERENENQVSKITEEMSTTNETLKYFLNTEVLIEVCNEEIQDIVYSEDNLDITTQHKKIGDYYASSFEEALILTNYDKPLLNKALQATKPRIWKQITEDGEKLEENKNNSYFWQLKLNSSKTEFANNLLYYLINTDMVNDTGESLILPEYISKALSRLENKLANNMVREG